METKGFLRCFYYDTVTQIRLSVIEQFLTFLGVSNLSLNNSGGCKVLNNWLHLPAVLLLQKALESVRYK